MAFYSSTYSFAYIAGGWYTPNNCSALHLDAYLYLSGSWNYAAGTTPYIGVMGTAYAYQWDSSTNAPYAVYSTGSACEETLVGVWRSYSYYDIPIFSWGYMGNHGFLNIFIIQPSKSP